MKLVTNSNNINTLKLLICGNVSNSKFEMAFTAPSKVDDYYYIFIFSVAKATLQSQISVRSSESITLQQLEIKSSFILHHSSFILPSFRDF